MDTLEARLVVDTAGRESILLGNGLLRAVIERYGGFVPELSFRRGNGYLNAHWSPHFRGVSEPYDPAKHAGAWSSRLMYELAGNFPCVPNFGPPSSSLGYPANGYTATGTWELVGHGTRDGEATYCAWRMADCENGFRFLKLDALFSDHPALYSVIRFCHDGAGPVPVNAAWHNTVGAPFLETGCLIDTRAETFATPPYNAIPGQHERLAKEATFDSLSRAPLRSGHIADLRVVPGMIGYSDFITGAIPRSARLGWNSVLNRQIEALYLCLFKGPAATAPEEFPLYFSDFWLQFGGRPFLPWAKFNGGSDLTFCVGAECATAALAHGLDLSLRTPEILGNPTFIMVDPGEVKMLFQATVLAEYPGLSRWDGVEKVEQEYEGIRIVDKGGKHSFALHVDAGFERIMALMRLVCEAIDP